MLQSLVALLLLLFMFPAQSAFNGGRSGTVSATAGGGGGGGITVVNTAVVGNVAISDETTTQTLGFTTGSGHFFVAMGYTSGDFVGATLEPSGTAMTCPSANQLDGVRTTILVCYLANGPSGQTSVIWTYSSSNGNTAESAFAEYAGMSLTAAPVNTSVQCPASFSSATSWSCGPYIATANNLVWSTCGTVFGGGSLSGFSPWNDRIEHEGDPSFMNMWWFDQLGPAAGSYTGASSYQNLGAGMYYDCMTGSFV
jgi:hypothetical protein